MTCVRERLRNVDWKGCWRRADVWLALAALLVPFGLVLLALRWVPARFRRRP